MLDGWGGGRGIERASEHICAAVEAESESCRLEWGKRRIKFKHKRIARTSKSNLNFLPGL
jgi:hypothetical protein